MVREQLDLSQVFAAYTSAKGQSPFHLTMMTEVLLFAYTRGIYSSRRIAKACEEPVDFIAVTGMQKPDFRKRDLSGLGSLFVQALRLCPDRTPV